MLLLFYPVHLVNPVYLFPVLLVTLSYLRFRTSASVEGLQKKSGDSPKKVPAPGLKPHFARHSFNHMLNLLEVLPQRHALKRDRVFLLDGIVPDAVPGRVISGARILRGQLD